MQADAHANTYGALILGALCASGLSGIVTAQSFIYSKLFPSDRKPLKCLVLFVWTLDLTHIGLVWAGIWDYFIANFGTSGHVDFIPGTIAISVVLTATLTFLAHCLFAHRIYHLSRKNKYLTMLVIALAFGRLAAATVSGIEMIHLHSYTLFRQKFLWLFTLGLSLSCAVDIMITFSLFFLLEKNRKETIMLQHVIDSLILYAFEIGSLTSAATVVSMLCWVLLNNSLIFLGLHFVIGQLYANSLLATLNSRDGIRRAYSSSLEHYNLTLQENGAGTLQFYHPQQQHRCMNHNHPVPISTTSSPTGRISVKSNEALSSPV
ncbi:hypothetical protein BYT27DRAFT_7180283 [Phlegmacium glaucopus]|nr:hypothetical protein BYT27DRAFT_7180283 [Phlegmacium glaucopus]